MGSRCGWNGGSGGDGGQTQVGGISGNRAGLMGCDEEAGATFSQVLWEATDIFNQGSHFHFAELTLPLGARRESISGWGGEWQQEAPPGAVARTQARRKVPPLTRAGVWRGRQTGGGF